MCGVTRRLADRRILGALDRKPRVANLWIMGLLARLATDLFIARTTRGQSFCRRLLINLP
jgi:hypothetical protein